MILTTLHNNSVADHRVIHSERLQAPTCKAAQCLVEECLGASSARRTSEGCLPCSLSLAFCTCSMPMQHDQSNCCTNVQVEPAHLENRCTSAFASHASESNLLE